jgi:branched-subunit amino acid transport protein AzlD
MLSLESAAAAVFASALVILGTRAFPFLLFSKREPPAVLRFIEKYIPPMVMAILIVYCLRTANWTSPPFGIPEIASLALVAALHIWKSNAMLSILCGTALFMLLSKFM